MDTDIASKKRKGGEHIDLLPAPKRPALTGLAGPPTASNTLGLPTTARRSVTPPTSDDSEDLDTTVLGSRATRRKQSHNQSGASIEKKSEKRLRRINAEAEKFLALWSAAFESVTSAISPGDLEMHEMRYNELYAEVMDKLDNKRGAEVAREFLKRESALSLASDANTFIASLVSSHKDADDEAHDGDDSSSSSSDHPPTPDSPWSEDERDIELSNKSGPGSALAQHKERKSNEMKDFFNCLWRFSKQKHAPDDEILVNFEVSLQQHLIMTDTDQPNAAMDVDNAPSLPLATQDVIAPKAPSSKPKVKEVEVEEPTPPQRMDVDEILNAPPPIASPPREDQTPPIDIDPFGSLSDAGYESEVEDEAILQQVLRESEEDANKKRMETEEDDQELQKALQASLSEVTNKPPEEEEPEPPIIAPPVVAPVTVAPAPEPVQVQPPVISEPPAQPQQPPQETLTASPIRPALPLPPIVNLKVPTAVNQASIPPKVATVDLEDEEEYEDEDSFVFKDEDDDEIPDFSRRVVDEKPAVTEVLSKRKLWTPAQDAKLWKTIEGSRRGINRHISWTLVCEQFPDRTKTAITQRWNIYKAKMKRMGNEVDHKATPAPATATASPRAEATSIIVSKPIATPAAPVSANTTTISSTTVQASPQAVSASLSATVPAVISQPIPIDPVNSVQEPINFPVIAPATPIAPIVVAPTIPIASPRAATILLPPDAQTTGAFRVFDTLPVPQAQLLAPMIAPQAPQVVQPAYQPVAVAVEPVLQAVAENPVVDATAPSTTSTNPLRESKSQMTISEAQKMVLGDEWDIF